MNGHRWEALEISINWIRNFFPLEPGRQFCQELFFLLQNFIDRVLSVLKNSSLRKYTLNSLNFWITRRRNCVLYHWVRYLAGISSAYVDLHSHLITLFSNSFSVFEIVSLIENEVIWNFLIIFLVPSIQFMLPSWFWISGDLEIVRLSVYTCTPLSFR